MYYRGTFVLFSSVQYVQATDMNYILGQKRNAAYKTYILYAVSFTNLSQTICHRTSTDTWVIGPSGCPSNHCHRTKLIEQLTPTYGFIDLYVASLLDDVMNAHGLALFEFVRNVSLNV